MKKFAFAVITTAVFASIITGCGETKEVKTSSVAATIAPQVEETKPVETKEVVEVKQEENKVFGLNEPGVLNQVEVTVNSVSKSKGQEFITPDEGKEFVIVDVTVKNKRDSIISYNPMYFQMQNSNGEITTVSIVMFSDNSFESGDLAPGGTTSGTIVFEQPINDANLQLQYTSSTGEILPFNISK